MRKREGEGEGREEMGAGTAGLPGEDLSFHPREVGALEDCGWRRGWT